MNQPRRNKENAAAPLVRTTPRIGGVSLFLIIS